MCVCWCYHVWACGLKAVKKESECEKKCECYSYMWWHLAHLSIKTYIFTPEQKSPFTVPLHSGSSHLCFRPLQLTFFKATEANQSHIWNRTDVLPQDLVKSRSHEIGCCNYRIAIKFYRHLGSAAAEVPVKFQSDWKSVNPNLAASRLHEILR